MKNLRFYQALGGYVYEAKTLTMKNSEGGVFGGAPLAKFLNLQN